MCVSVCQTPQKFDGLQTTALNQTAWPEDSEWQKKRRPVFQRTTVWRLDLASLNSSSWQAQKSRHNFWGTFQMLRYTAGKLMASCLKYEGENECIEPDTFAIPLRPRNRLLQATILRELQGKVTTKLQCSRKRKEMRLWSLHCSRKVASCWYSMSEGL